MFSKQHKVNPWCLAQHKNRLSRLGEKGAQFQYLSARSKEEISFATLFIHKSALTQVGLRPHTVEGRKILNGGKTNQETDGSGCSLSAW